MSVVHTFFKLETTKGQIVILGLHLILFVSLVFICAYSINTVVPEVLAHTVYLCMLEHA